MLTWLSGFLLQIVEWGLPLIVKDLEKWYADYSARQAQKVKDAKSASEFKKEVDNKQATEQERKDAENAALNS